MSGDMRGVDMDQLDALLGAATMGPWACNDEPESYVAREGRVWATEMPDGFDDEVAVTVMQADAAVIVAAVNAAGPMATALRAVLALHVRDADTDSCPQCGRAWPCPTFRALGSA